MTRLRLERNQVFIYLAALVIGLAIGIALPELGAAGGSLLWPLLIALLYATFIQIPLAHLRQSLADIRFISAVLVGNFVLLPLVVWGLLQWLPDNLPLRLGVLLVLLVPCTDWFISFTHLSKGDASAAVTVTPLNLLLQLILLPVYLWLILGTTTGGAPLGDLLSNLAPAALLILLPLLAAFLTELWISKDTRREALSETLAWAPVPLLALVILLIAATQVSAVAGAFALLPNVLPVFVAFLLLSALLAKLLAKLWRLPVSQGRTLAFSLGTRNSFVVLPLALALPAGWELAAAVIVLQSLIELGGMLIYLKWIPGWLFPSADGRDTPAP